MVEVVTCMVKQQFDLWFGVCGWERHDWGVESSPLGPPCCRESLTHQGTQPLEGSAQLKAMPLWWRLKCSQRNAPCEQLTLMFD